MRKVQFRLPKDDLDALRELAAREGVSVSAMIRRGVCRIIEEKGKPSRRELMERALGAAGKCPSEVRDLGRRHDDYFAEAAAAED